MWDVWMRTRTWALVFPFSLLPFDVSGRTVLGLVAFRVYVRSTASHDWRFAFCFSVCTPPLGSGISIAVFYIPLLFLALRAQAVPHPAPSRRASAFSVLRPLSPVARPLLSVLRSPGISTRGPL